MIKQSRPTTAIPTGAQDQQLRELVGSNLSQFQIMNELGKGSYGTVYKVKSTLDQGIYVLKKINLTHLKSKQSAEALKEAQLLRKLKHPNIISYFVSFIEQDHLCIVMEYADGGDLQKLLKDYKERRKYLPEEMIWEMAKELSSALQHIHENNIIHRDIKTLNVFLTKDKKIKLGDLGVSKIFNSDIALQGTRVGTPLYLAPELVQHHPYDYKVDIWALGCVIFHMAALEPPFHGDNLISLGYNIVNKAPKGLPPQYSPSKYNSVIFFSNYFFLIIGLTQFIWKLLEKMPTLRPSIIEINNSYFQQQRQIQQRQEFPQRPQTSHVRSNAIQQETEKLKKTQRKFNESVNFDNTQKQQELVSEDRVFSRNLQIQQQIQQQQQKLEQERLEKEKIEKERLEKIEKERLERERLEKERQEREREKDRQERERLERLEREKIEREKQEQERIERERREQQKQQQKEQIAQELKPQLQEQKNIIRIQQQNIELYIQEIDEKRELTLDQVKLNSKSRYIKGPATIRPLSAQTRGGSFANLVNCRARNILPTSQHQSVKEVKKFTIFDIKGYQSEEQRDVYIQQQPYIQQPEDRKEGESQSQPPIQQVQYKPKENNVRIKSAVLLINQRKSNEMKNSNHIVKHYTLKDIID